MIRKRKRSEKAKALLAYKQAAPFGVGETRDEQMVRQDVIERAVIEAVHDYIWKTRTSCQLCHGSRRSECAGMPDEMHEDPSRAETRGRPAHERFNLIVCSRLCLACHRDVTENRIEIEFTVPALGFMAPVRARPK